MNDLQLRDLLDRAVPDSYPRGGEFRLRKGQSVRRRRRLVGVGAGAAAALVVGGGTAVVASTWSPDDSAQPASGGSTAAPPSTSPTAAEDATATPPADETSPPQPDYQVTYFPKSRMSFAIPDGWEVHRPEPSAAVSLNKIGEPVNEDDGWIGELVVMTSEPEFALGASDDTVTHDGRVYSFRRNGDGQGSLVVDAAPGGPVGEVQLQYPVDIDLTRDQLIALADSVALDDNAILGKG